MTSAPRSARWRVAKGSAAACSMDSTRTPASGRRLVRLLFHFGPIEPPCFVFPERRGGSVRFAGAADLEDVGVTLPGQPLPVEGVEVRVDNRVVVTSNT